MFRPQGISKSSRGLASGGMNGNWGREVIDRLLAAAGNERLLPMRTFTSRFCAKRS
jgi:hypothetical protein